MQLLLKNSLYRLITLSRLLNSIGSYLYNLVFVVYAASLPQANLAVFMANITTIIPTLLTFWIGVRADYTQNKAKWMIRLGFVQASLFTMVALIIENKTFLVFSIVCLLNILSDLISDYIAGLRLPILQYNIASEDLFEAYSFAQFSIYLANILGQALGVYLLTISDNHYAFVALINALTFFLSSYILWKNKKQLRHQKLASQTKKEKLSHQFREMFSNMEDIFKKHSSSTFVSLLLSILILNALGGAIGSIYNLYFLEQGLLNLSYGQSILLMEMILLVGAILGSLTTSDYFSKQDFSFLLPINAVLFFSLALANFLGVDLWVGLILLFIAAYIMSKITPKLDALLMEHLPPETLARSDHFLSMLFTLSLPLGTFVFSSIAVYNSRLAWLLFGLLSLIMIPLSLKK